MSRVLGPLVVLVLCAFGPCEGCSDEETCGEPGDPCSGASCCSGSCVDNGSGGRCDSLTCLVFEDRCTDDVQCCSNACTAGSCTCSDVDQACHESVDCCDHLTCNQATARCEQPPAGEGSTSFFVTSIGSANAGDLGGLDAADQLCQTLIAAANVSAAVQAKTWRAYLSTTPIFTNGVPAGAPVHARDRIGAGPWFNLDGAMIAASLAELHSTGIDPGLIVDELGGVVPAAEHAILTGSKPDGTAETEQDNDFLMFGFDSASCGNWTSNNSFRNTLAGTSDGGTWNSGQRVFCDLAPQAASSGRIYCFAL